MSDDLRRLEDLEPGMVAVLGVPSDENSSFLRGAAKGPARIRAGRRDRTRIRRGSTRRAPSSTRRTSASTR